MSNDVDLTKIILDKIRIESPDSLKTLIEEIIQEYDIPKDIVLEKINYLEKEGKLRFSTSIKKTPSNIFNYLLSVQVTWFWITIVISTSTLYQVLFLQEKTLPYVYLRYILGAFFVLILPGFSFIKAIFPTKEIDRAERMALSLGMSLVITPLIGLLLNYSPWGIRLTPVTLSLFAFTTLFTFIGVLREYYENHSRATKKALA